MRRQEKNVKDKGLDPGPHLYFPFARIRLRKKVTQIQNTDFHTLKQGFVIYLFTYCLVIINYFHMYKNVFLCMTPDSFQI